MRRRASKIYVNGGCSKRWKVKKKDEKVCTSDASRDGPVARVVDLTLGAVDVSDALACL